MPSIIGGIMNIKEIEKTTEYKNDWNQCTVVASSVAFNMDYKKVHKFYMANGRKKNRGLLPFHTERIMQELAKYEGYKITLFKPTFELNDIRKWVSGSNDYSRGERYRAKFIPDGKEQLCIINKHITPNNQDDYLPTDNYIMGVSGHVIGIKNGVVNDWTEGRKHQAKSIWRIEKTGKKVKRQTFSDCFDELMDFEF